MPTCSKRSVGMIEDTPNPQSSNGGGDRSLGISFVRRLEPKTLKHSLTHLFIKLTSLLGPKGKRSGSHKMSRSYDPKRQTQQENGFLCVSKSISLLITPSATSKRSLLTKDSVNS